ncbi:MAG TPA: bifunctional riboflavin kinase/FAD synthetase [Chitinophagaceae bacterium]|jgi:riboflavin kinase/FMN adenylyltransferase
MPIFAPFFMQVHYKSNQLPVFSNAVVTIGTFDGVHRGHRQILDKLLQEARKINGETVIITFDPHPRKIVGTQQPAIKLINTLDEKIELLRQTGIDHLVIIDFTPEFANQHADDYIKDFLVGKFQPHTIIIGYDHRFGKNREGDFRLLERMAPVFNYQLKEIPQHVLNEAAISSTRIREAILRSNIKTANELLGYDFFFSGEVVHGDKLGRQLGYPTVNLQMNDEEKITAGNGIYAVYISLNNEIKKGMMSIGLRPTVGGTKRVIEVNIFDFNADVYGQTLTVTIKKHLRAEVKFNSLEELKAQMAKDKIESLAVL